MNNVVIRKVIVTAAYAPLSPKSEIVTVEISAPPSNSAPVMFRGDDGSDVPWIPGEFHSFKSIDLKAIEIKGTPGDVVTLNGGAW